MRPFPRVKPEPKGKPPLSFFFFCFLFWIRYLTMEIKKYIGTGRKASWKRAVSMDLMFIMPLMEINKARIAQYTKKIF